MSKSDKLLIIYNTVGIGKETVSYYVEALDSIYNQSFQDFDITIASCLHDDQTRQSLQRLYPKVDIYCINQKLPIHASFNHAIIETLRHRSNDYFAYTYFEAGAVLKKKNDLQILVDKIKSNPTYGIVTPISSHDNGLLLNFGIGNSNDDLSAIETLFQGKPDYIIPPGFATNLHIALYSKTLFDYYGKLQPDILSSHCMESLLACVCAAINTNWIMTKDVLIEHRKLPSIDSICFNPYERKAQGLPTWNHGYIIEDVIDRLFPGIDFGLTYENCESILPVDPTKFDEKNFALDYRLAPFIKQNVYLQEDELPHDSIKSEFMRGKR